VKPAMSHTCSQGNHCFAWDCFLSRFPSHDFVSFLDSHFCYRFVWDLVLLLMISTVVLVNRVFWSSAKSSSMEESLWSILWTLDACSLVCSLEHRRTLLGRVDDFRRSLRSDLEL